MILNSDVSPWPGFQPPAELLPRRVEAECEAVGRRGARTRADSCRVTTDLKGSHPTALGAVSVIATVSATGTTLTAGSRCATRTVRHARR